MIVDQTGEFTVVHDMGRPTFTEEDHFRVWRQYFDFIEKSDIEIVVNGLYWMMREWCDNRKKHYGGGGYKFCFWFKSEEDHEKFLDGIEEIRGYRMKEITGERLVRYKQYIYDHYPEQDEYFFRSIRIWFSEPLT